MLADLERQEAAERRWARLAELIGSADGKKFRNYAQQFTLDVYREACMADAQCTTGLSVCSHGRCVQCADEFDCSDATLPRCDTTLKSCG